MRGLNHHKSNTRLFHIWCGVKQRCYYHKHKQYKDYGGRGIAVCDEWLRDFMNFYNWAITNGYRENLTIDRIDNNGNYEPNNCRWVTIKQQQRNKSTCRNITINGETHCLMEWCEILNLKYDKIRMRLNRLGWSIERALELEEK